MKRSESSQQRLLGQKTTIEEHQRSVTQDSTPKPSEYNFAGDEERQKPRDELQIARDDFTRFMIDVVGKNKATSDMKTEMDLENSILDDVKKMMEQAKQY